MTPAIGESDIAKVGVHMKPMGRNLPRWTSAYPPQPKMTHDKDPDAGRALRSEQQSFGSCAGRPERDGDRMIARSKRLNGIFGAIVGPTCAVR